MPCLGMASQSYRDSLPWGRAKPTQQLIRWSITTTAAAMSVSATENAPLDFSRAFGS